VAGKECRVHSRELMVACPLEGLVGWHIAKTCNVEGKAHLQNRNRLDSERQPHRQRGVCLEESVYSDKLREVKIGILLFIIAKDHARLRNYSQWLFSFKLKF